MRCRRDSSTTTLVALSTVDFCIQRPSWFNLNSEFWWPTWSVDHDILQYWSWAWSSRKSSSVGGLSIYVFVEFIFNKIFSWLDLAIAQKCSFSVPSLVATVRKERFSSSNVFSFSVVRKFESASVADALHHRDEHHRIRVQIGIGANEHASLWWC